MIEVGTRVSHIYSTGQRSGVVIQHSGAAAFRGQIRVKWFNTGIADYVLERFLTVEGEAFLVVAEPGLASIEEDVIEVSNIESQELESDIQEQAYEIVEESTETYEPVVVESNWAGFEIREGAQLNASGLSE